MRYFFFTLFLFIAVASGGAITYFYFPNQIQTTVYTLPEVGEKSVTKEDLTFGALPQLSNTDFFQKTKQSLIDAHAEFIEADLTSMKLRVYQNGVQVKVVTIMTKGKEGLWWQTPAGLYKIENKEKKHYSSFGHVYENWNLAFQGNFFIHGWPYYEGGAPVASQFSGGCIRLSDEDAKSVYDIVKVGDPVLVFEKAFDVDHFVYQGKAPHVTASSYLVADLRNNFLFAGKEATTTRPIASLTKLVTALVASEYINLDKNIIVQESSLASTSVKRLHAGESFTAYGLLFPLLLESSNESAEVLATPLGRKRFISLMNKKAMSIGMNSTVFTDPAGREAGNVSTPEDLFALAKYIYVNRSFIFRITSETLTGSAYVSPFSKLANFNLYKGDSTFIGGKIGKSTSAGETYLGVFELTLNGEKRPIVIVVLDSQDVKADVDALKDFVTQEYTLSENGEETEASTSAILNE